VQSSGHVVYHYAPFRDVCFRLAGATNLSWISPGGDLVGCKPVMLRVDMWREGGMVKQQDFSCAGKSPRSGWWQLKHFFFSPRILGEMIQFDSYYSKGLKPPTSPRLIEVLHKCVEKFSHFHVFCLSPRRQI